MQFPSYSREVNLVTIAGSKVKTINIISTEQLLLKEGTKYVRFMDLSSWTTKFWSDY